MLGGYFMAAVWAATSCSRGGLSSALQVVQLLLWFQVEVRSTWIMELYTFAITYWYYMSYMLAGSHANYIIFDS